MKTRIAIVLAILVAISAATVDAAPEGGKWLLTPNLGAVFVHKDEDGGKYNGVTVNLALEKVNPSGKYALGFAAGTMWIIGTAPEDSDSRAPVYTSRPVYLTFKYFALSSERATGYLGLGAGVQVSDRDWENQSERKVGAAFAVPVGVQIWTHSGLYFNINYTFNYLNDSWYKDDIVHMVNLGVGFQF
jgi:hypothetical protein